MLHSKKINDLFQVDVNEIEQKFAAKIFPGN